MYASRTVLLGWTALLIVGCTSPAPTDGYQPNADKPARDTSHWHGPDALEQIHFPQVADNIQHDTLAIQTTFDLGDGTFVMVAANVEEPEEQKKGLRLYRYRAMPDSSAAIVSVSPPAYDSWTMLPTFFAIGPKTWIVLANFGEKESWGQLVLRLDSSGFARVGFLEAVLPTRVVETDSAYLRRTSIAPFVRISAHEPLTVEFASDSVYIYDDGAGGRDYMIPSADVSFVLDSAVFRLHRAGEIVARADTTK